MDQTRLANERTLLAYLRTALQFMVAGVSLVRFFGNRSVTILGWFLVAVGLLLPVIGTVLFVRRRRALTSAHT